MRHEVILISFTIKKIHIVVQPNVDILFSLQNVISEFWRNRLAKRQDKINFSGQKGKALVVLTRFVNCLVYFSQYL